MNVLIDAAIKKTSFYIIFIFYINETRTFSLSFIIYCYQLTSQCICIQ